MVITLTAVRVHVLVLVLVLVLLTEWADANPSYFDSLMGHIERLLTPSNCVDAGGGSQGIVYEHCLGCDVVEAQKCVDDMRNNVTGNIPVGCYPSALGDAHVKQECCPLFYGVPEEPWLVLPSTTGYPDAIKCLIDIGCDQNPTYYDLLAECHEQECCCTGVSIVDELTGVITYGESDCSSGDRLGSWSVDQNGNGAHEYPEDYDPDRTAPCWACERE